MKESEITILKKEIEWMKHKLRECTAGAKTIKAKKASGHSVSKKKAAEADQTC